ncbi:hypothetical protein ACVWXM_010011 [Bradyrhizobium sp. GM7.3]
MSPTILERDRISWLLPTTEAMEKNRKWAIGLTDCGMRPRPFWPHRNGDRGQWHPRSFERHRIAQLGDCVGANVQPLERSTMDSDKLSGPECGEMILTRNPYHSRDSNSMFSSEFKMMLPNCSTTGSSGLTVAGRKTARVAAPWHPVPFLEQKRCSEGFFVQKGLVGVICNGNTASETTMRAAPIVLRVRLTFDELDACDLIFSPPTSVERSDCGTSPHNGRARPAHSRVHRSSCRDMPPSTRRPPAWIESDESYAFRFLLPAESLDQNWP